MLTPSPLLIISLYRLLFKKAIKFDNYNFREFAKRRVHDAFKENKSVTDPEKVARLYNEGVDNLAMLERQAAILQMFTFEKLVVEPLKKHH